MKEYPKIFGVDERFLGRSCIAQVKYDGSNLRFEYSRKQNKWYKFGTRRHLFAENDPEYGTSVPLFLSKYGEQMAKIFCDRWKADYMTVFAEFFGPNSFAGWHHPDDSKQIVAFDVCIHKKGFLSPIEFLKYFGHLPVAEVVHQGLLTKDLIQEIKESTSLVEGVICKGGEGHKLWMCKIKTLKYLHRLKEKYGDKWEEYV